MNVYKKLLIAIGIVILSLFAFHSVIRLHKESDKNIHVIHSYQEVTESMKKWNDSTFIFFDVDDTLIYGPYLFPDDFLSRLLFRIRFLIRYPQLIKPDLWEEYYSLMWAQAERVLIEKEIAHVIQNLQNRGSTVLGLTAMETGSYGVIDSMPEWRANMLTGLGIIFSRSFKDHLFTSFKSYRSHYPALYKGILCCNKQSKSEVLAAFLDTYQVKPEKIVFFDDRYSEVRGVADLCKKRKIRFEGYQYKGAERLHTDWSMQKALAQIDSLIQNRAWIN